MSEQRTHPCENGCGKRVRGRFKYCPECAHKRKLESNQRCTRTRQNKTGPDSPNFFRWKWWEVVSDPGPAPLCPGLSFSPHASTVMVDEGCFTPGTILRDWGGQEYTYPAVGADAK